MSKKNSPLKSILPVTPDVHPVTAPIGNALTSAAGDHVVATATDIYDTDFEAPTIQGGKTKGAYQVEINKRVQRAYDTVFPTTSYKGIATQPITVDTEQYYVNPTTPQLTLNAGEEMMFDKTPYRQLIIAHNPVPTIVATIPANTAFNWGVPADDDYSVAVDLAGNDTIYAVERRIQGGGGGAVYSPGDGISIENNTIAVDINPYQMKVNGANQLGVKTDESTITTGTATGLEVKVGKSLEKTTSGLDVKAGDTSLESTTSGLKVKVGATIETATAGLEVKVADKSLATLTDGLSVNLADKKGLETTTAGIAVKVDGTSIKVNDAGELEAVGGGGGDYTAGDGIDISTAGKISVKVDGTTVKFNANKQLEAIGKDYTASNGVQIVGDTISVKPLDSSLTTEAGGVKVAVSEGLTTDTGGIRVKCKDNSLYTDGVGVAVNTSDGLEVVSGGVKVKPKADSPISVTTDGVDLSIDKKTLEVEDETLKAHLKEKGGLTATNAGIEVKYDSETMGIDSIGSLYTKLKDKGGLAQDGQGISADVDNETIKLNNGKITANLNPQGGLTSDLEGISISVGSTLTVDENNLMDVKPDTTKGLQTSSTGLAVKVDGQTVMFNGAGELTATGGGGEPTVYSAGDGLSLDGATKTFSVKVDGTTVKFNANKQLEAVGGSTLEAGNGISIASDKINVKPADNSIDVSASGVKTKVWDNNGIVVSPNGLMVMTDGDSTKIDATGKVAVNINPEGGIGADLEGLYVKIDGTTITADSEGVLSAGGGSDLSAGNGISITSDKINVKPADTSIDVSTAGTKVKVFEGKGIMTSPNGLMIMTDEATITCDPGAMGMVKAKLDESTGIGTNDTGICINTDGKSIKPTTNKQLAVQVDNTKALEVTTSGLAVKVDNDSIKFNSSGQLEATPYEEGNGITITDKTITAKPKTNGGITVDANGIAPTLNSADAVKLDTATYALDVKIDEATLTKSTTGILSAVPQNKGGLKKVTTGTYKGLALNTLTANAVKVDTNGYVEAKYDDITIKKYTSSTAPTTDLVGCLYTPTLTVNEIEDEVASITLQDNVLVWQDDANKTTNYTLSLPSTCKLPVHELVLNLMPRYSGNAVVYPKITLPSGYYWNVPTLETQSSYVGPVAYYFKEEQRFVPGIAPSGKWFGASSVTGSDYTFDITNSNPSGTYFNAHNPAAQPLYVKSIGNAGVAVISAGIASVADAMYFAGNSANVFTKMTTRYFDFNSKGTSLRYFTIGPASTLTDKSIWNGGCWLEWYPPVSIKITLVKNGTGGVAFWERIN